jgi:prefoldin alpha subunit
MAVEKKIEELALLHELKKQQLSAVLARQQLMREQMLECNQAVNAMEIYGKEKRDSEIFMPLGADCFVYVKIQKPGKIITGIGADLFVEKSVNDAKEMINSKMKEIQEQNKKLGELGDKLKRDIDNIEAEIQAEYEKSQDKNVQAPKKQY